MRSAQLWASVFCALISGCADATPPPVDPGPSMQISAITHPNPVLAGTVLAVAGASLDRAGFTPTLNVFGEDGESIGALTALPGSNRDEKLFAVSSEMVAALTPGKHTLMFVLAGNGLESAPFPFEVDVQHDLELRVDPVAASMSVHRNDTIVLHGEGFIFDMEGDSFVHLSGSFTRDVDANVEDVEAYMPLVLVERTSRERAIVRLTTDLGGIWPGVFQGTLELISEPKNGSPHFTEPQTIELRFEPPVLFGVTPEIASLGQKLKLTGAGFLGGADRPEELSLVRIVGTFREPGGGSRTINQTELVPSFVSGTELGIALEPAVDDGKLISRLFGAARGTFEGTATPITMREPDELEGAPVPFSFTLGPVTQVVYLEFLPGFYSALERFGVGAASARIEEAVVERINGIYADYNVDVRLEEPTDFALGSYVVVEIGGPDPYGQGLLGYDNGSGKDVGNLRLGDRIGGLNPAAPMNAGRYGGVFIESFLWWSAHPDLPVRRPTGGSAVEPLFDQLFDPVRSRPVTLAELRGEGEPDRLAQVEAAVRALASLIGETTSHELGHSFGLANPHVAGGEFHNEADGEGCLMDAGQNRPVAERTQQPGAARTVFCYDEPEYLESILGG